MRKNCKDLLNEDQYCPWCVSGTLEYTECFIQYYWKYLRLFSVNEEISEKNIIEKFNVVAALSSHEYSVQSLLIYFGAALIENWPQYEKLFNTLKLLR